MPEFGLDKKQVTILKNIFAKYPGITKVVIFGSRAKNNHQPFSDIDLCVYGKLDETTLNKMKFDLVDSSLIYKVDLVLFESIINDKLKQNILTDGKIFWES